ncbi:Leucine Rich repeats (2 copies) [Pirellula sp. SH-Sr6A]|uniref:leucine-rich repeat domain-containing protein n=1 Tax=Pirellula sp. SH-Sr6A TaxID=1632865 RepID=UPI00078E77E1|nr:leucine-rich repeat domain-containing protein [Pirellula sp. SH-Sr6A]AMV32672.1 Leucine Rich repeats (2 copies) [Pirellula sp. SH-Sr6A]
MNEVRIEDSLPENPAVSVPRPRWFHCWPLGLFLLVLFSFDCLLPSAMNILPREISKGYLGVFVGHLLIASIVASLLFPSWILGTLVGSLFVSIAFGSVLWGSGSYSLLVQGGEGQVWRLIWGVLPAPFVVLACSLPLLIIRSLRGWRIQRTEARVHGGQRIRLEDIFLTMIVLAAVLSLSIAPSIAMEIERRDYLLGIAVIGAFLMFVCLLGGIPFLWIRHWKQDPLSRIGAPFIWMLLVGILSSMLYSLYMELQRSTIAVSSLTSMCVAAFFIATLPILFMESLRASGFQFVSQFPPKSEQQVSEKEEALIRRSQWQQRLGAGIMALMAIGIHIPASNLNKSRIAEDQWLADRYQQIHEQGGELRVSRGQIVSVAFSDPKFQSVDIEQFPAPEQVERLSLAGATVGDEIVSSLSRYTSLQSLDLSHTGITDSSVPALREQTGLKHLSISGTKLSRDSILRLASLWHLQELDLGDLDLDNEFRLPSTWSLKPERSISLKGNRRLTDALASHPENDLSRGRFGYLDFSSTGITGSLFEKPISVRRLTLHDVRITDDIMARYASNMRVSGFLSLEHTLLTDAILPVMAASIPSMSWSLGDGNFTDAGLSALKSVGFIKLELRGKQFTGVCFETWSPMLYEINFSGSSLSDDTIEHLRNMGSLQSIGLAGTAITDRSLAEIARFPMTLATIDVSDTSVTVEGLTEYMSPYTEIVVRPGQFTPEELRLLRSRMTVSVGRSVRSYR